MPHTLIPGSVPGAGRLLIVGAGQRTTEVLLPALRRAGLDRGARSLLPAAICDPDPAAVRRVAEAQAKGLVSDGTKVFRDLGQALDAGRYQVAIVACPHDQHQDVTLRLREDQVPVWKEKPFALTLEHALQLAADDVRVLAHRPHSQLVQLAADQLARLGRLLSYRITIARATSDYSGTWRAFARQAGGGAICDLGYHAFDLISRWTGHACSPPATVYAVAYDSPSVRPVVEVEESAHLTITHSDGCAGTVHLSRCADRADDIALVAEHGTITISGSSARIRVTGTGGAVHQVAVDAVDDPCAAMLRHHVATMTDRDITTAEARIGVAATALLEAAYASLRLECPVPVAFPAFAQLSPLPIPHGEGTLS
jgi:predicted dehydrogenase